MQAIHLTSIGDGNVLLEPGDSLDPDNSDAYLKSLVDQLQKFKAKCLLYDLKNIPMIDKLYYKWLLDVNAICRLSSVKLVVISMRPATAYALSISLDKTPPFGCALDANAGREK